MKRPTECECCKSTAHLMDTDIGTLCEDCIGYLRTTGYDLYVYPEVHNDKSAN